MAQPFNLGNSFLGKSTIDLITTANNAVHTSISVDADGDLLFESFVSNVKKGDMKFPVHSYGRSEKKNMHTDSNGNIRFATTYTEPEISDITDGDNSPLPVITGVEYLVIAGGGGGGYRRAGGDGAGGYRSSVPGELSGGGEAAEPTITLDLPLYTISIGEGGAGSTSEHPPG